MVYKPKKETKKERISHASAPNSKLNTSIKFCKEFLRQTIFYPFKSPVELIQTRNQLWYLLQQLN